MTIETFNKLKEKFLKEIEIENSKDLDYYELKISQINSLFGKAVNLMFTLGQEYAELSLYIEKEQYRLYEENKWSKSRTYSDKDALSKTLENDDFYNLRIKKSIIEEQIKVMESIKKAISDMNFQLKNIITVKQMKMGYVRG